MNLNCSSVPKIKTAFHPVNANSYMSPNFMIPVSNIGLNQKEISIQQNSPISAYFKKENCVIQQNNQESPQQIQLHSQEDEVISRHSIGLESIPDEHEWKSYEFQKSQKVQPKQVKIEEDIFKLEAQKQHIQNLSQQKVPKICLEKQQQNEGIQDSVNYCNNDFSEVMQQPSAQRDSELYQYNSKTQKNGTYRSEIDKNDYNFIYQTDKKHSPASSLKSASNQAVITAFKSPQNMNFNHINVTNKNSAEKQESYAVFKRNPSEGRVVKVVEQRRYSAVSCFASTSASKQYGVQRLFTPVNKLQQEAEQAEMRSGNNNLGFAERVQKLKQSQNQNQSSSQTQTQTPVKAVVENPATRQNYQKSQTAFVSNENSDAFVPRNYISPEVQHIIEQVKAEKLPEKYSAQKQQFQQNYPPRLNQSDFCTRQDWQQKKYNAQEEVREKSKSTSIVYSSKKPQQTSTQNLQKINDSPQRFDTQETSYTSYQKIPSSQKIVTVIKPVNYNETIQKELKERYERQTSQKSFAAQKESIQLLQQQQKLQQQQEETNKLQNSENVQKSQNLKNSAMILQQLENISQQINHNLQTDQELGMSETILELILEKLKQKKQQKKSHQNSQSSVSNHLQSQYASQHKPYTGLTESAKAKIEYSTERKQNLYIPTTSQKTSFISSSVFESQAKSPTFFSNTIQSLHTSTDKAPFSHSQNFSKAFSQLNSPQPPPFYNSHQNRFDNSSVAQNLQKSFNSFSGCVEFASPKNDLKYTTQTALGNITSLTNNQQQQQQNSNNNSYKSHQRKNSSAVFGQNFDQQQQYYSQKQQQTYVHQFQPPYDLTSSQFSNLNSSVNQNCRENLENLGNGGRVSGVFIKDYKSVRNSQLELKKNQNFDSKLNPLNNISNQKFDQSKELQRKNSLKMFVQNENNNSKGNTSVLAKLYQTAMQKKQGEKKGFNLGSKNSNQPSKNDLDSKAKSPLKKLSKQNQAFIQEIVGAGNSLNRYSYNTKNQHY